jgi:hypothetical protein
MNFSKPSLHAPVFTTSAHQSLVAEALVTATTTLAPRRLPFAAKGASFGIPLTTVSLNSNFDAYINVGYRGGSGASLTSLLVDSGNSSLIVPDYNVVAGLPNFGSDYAILVDSIQEPWGCPAKILRGPIQIPTQSGDVYEIQGCVFYACTDANQDGVRTANFGTGCISPWPAIGAFTIQSPLSYNTTYPYAEFNYAPAATVMAIGKQPNTVGGSSLTLYQTMPPGYESFDIIKDCAWMSLIPRALTIGTTKTAWPGDYPSPIAMVDTGGGPVFLSDPEGYIYSASWPEKVPSPPWTSSSDCCQSVKDDLFIVLGDRNGSFSYRVDATNEPPSVQGLTLVMCKDCSYMMGNQGMNIGGLSALFNFIVIDYSLARVGLKSKQPAVS